MPGGIFRVVDSKFPCSSFYLETSWETARVHGFGVFSPTPGLNLTLSTLTFSITEVERTFFLDPSPPGNLQGDLFPFKCSLAHLPLSMVKRYNLKNQLYLLFQE